MNAPTPREAMDWLHDLMTRNHTPLYGPWQGWRVAGRELVAPDGQRITPARVQGLLWRDEMELRRKGYASRRKAEADSKKNQLVKVVVIPLSQYLDGQKVNAA